MQRLSRDGTYSRAALFQVHMVKVILFLLNISIKWPVRFVVLSISPLKPKVVNNVNAWHPMYIYLNHKH